DRHLGLTVALPDGRGGRLKGRAFDRFTRRARLRERFESMRLLYVAATRARDRLILSGATKDLAKLGGEDTWLGWIWKAIEAGEQPDSRVLSVGGSIPVGLTMNLVDEEQARAADWTRQTSIEPVDLSASFDERFPLLSGVHPARQMAIHRFSVTQLLNYHRC